MYLFSLCWNEENRAFPPSLDEACFDNQRVFLYGYMHSVSCLLHFVMAMDVQWPNASTLCSFLRHKYSVSVSLFFSGFSFLQHYVIHRAQTLVMQYDLFSYQLLALSTLALLAPTLTYTHVQAKVFRCTASVSRWDKPVLRPTLQGVVWISVVCAIYRSNDIKQGVTVFVVRYVWPSQAICA